MVPALGMLRCTHCGSALELPADLGVVHIDCPHCGTDNVLPPGLIHARQEAYRVQAEQHHRAQQHAAQAAAREASSRFTRRLLGGLGLLVLVAGGLTAVLVVRACDALEAEAAALADPARNGQSAMAARLAALRAEQRCDRVLIHPTVHAAQPGPASLDLLAGADCVHVVAISGAGKPLAVEYTTTGFALSRPLPPAGPSFEYRLCARESGTHAFQIRGASDNPFTVAAIECPRTVAEGAARSKIDDRATNGVAVVDAQVKQLFSAGCAYVVAQPQPFRGGQTFTFNSKKDAPCLNALVGSAYPDVTFKLALTDPEGIILPVPEPAREARVMYCPKKDGAYKLEVTPSTTDHWAEAAVDCPRSGAEGLKREAALRRPRSP